MSEDSGSEDNIVVDGDDVSKVDVPDDIDPHLLLYNNLHAEIRSRASTNGRNLLTGLSTVGLIIAYSLLSGEFIFLAVVPIVIAVLIIQTVFYLNRIMLAAYQLM